MYNCDIEMEGFQQKNNQIILDDYGQYSYTIKPVEITNSLGVVIAILEEYFITNDNGEIYKLYKSKEGNWYDISDTIPVENNKVLRALKLAIDNK